jgi:DNA topoisomerase I
MLIIVESPAKAKTITSILKKLPDHKNTVVKASVGHIRKISNSTKSPDGKKLEINGINTNEDFLTYYEVDEDKSQIVREIKKLAKENKGEILFATDSDREGESISWHLTEVLGIKDKSKIKRLEFHEITDQAIRHAIDEPRDLNLYLVAAQQARQVLDKLVGYKLSPVIWDVMGNHSLSAGRVQSPALRIICDREEEIINFKTEEYWEIRGYFKSV